jgi:catechol 2,3-dioxygenase-like lactoylglutathione lyase family enzyme
MEQRVSRITLGVRDIARARTFYERLGWTAGVANDDVVFFKPAEWSSHSGAAATRLPKIAAVPHQPEPLMVSRSPTTFECGKRSTLHLPKRLLHLIEEAVRE